ncbi:MAG TPA: ATP-binding protein [Pseudolabrys sp.]|nr:ATP-binding protein [Pseudolabrys sp.]
MAKPKRKKAARKPAIKRAKKRKAARRPDAARAAEAALAGIAHDIRTPLTGIMALAELLASSDLGAREREWANAVKSGADHLAGLTSLIVDAVRADAAKLVLRNEPFSPRALAEAVGQGLSARAGSKNVAAQIDIAPDLPAMVTGDALRLRSALENIADNAVKFTSDGVVAFSARAEPATGRRLRLVYTLTDSGIGMSAAEIKRLFKPFAQANEQIARHYGGAGLGLVFVKRIAKAMGGDLKITSKPGHGSTFTFTALLAPADARLPGDARGSPSPTTRSLVILCAEDNPYGRVVMNTILGELGHRVDFVESGEAAVKTASSGQYDAVLMDVTLTGLDGMEATRRIRALPGNAGQVTVIGVSGRGSSDDEVAALAAGMDFYFAKPVSPRRLAEALASLPSPRLQSNSGIPEFDH